MGGEVNSSDCFSQGEHPGKDTGRLAKGGREVCLPVLDGCAALGSRDHRRSPPARRLGKPPSYRFLRPEAQKTGRKAGAHLMTTSNPHRSLTHVRPVLGPLPLPCYRWGN